MIHFGFTGNGKFAKLNYTKGSSFEQLILYNYRAGKDNIFGKLGNNELLHNMFYQLINAESPIVNDLLV